MKIAFIGQKGVPAIHGGVERHVHDLSVRLAKRGFDVTAYSRTWYTKTNDNLFEGVNVVHVPTLHTKHLDAIVHTFFATLHAMKSGFDVIHYHGVGPSLLSFLPRIFSPKTLVITTFHSIDRKHEKWGFFARFFLKLGEWTACKFSHKTIVVSRTLAQYVRDVYDIESLYIPNVVSSTQNVADVEILKQWNLKAKEYVLVVSRLIPHKGVHYIIDAWKNLLDSHKEILGNKKLVIVGDGYYTDEYVARLKEQAKDISSIVFTGFQSGSEISALYSHAFLMCHPSDNEGLPIVVLEAMSYKLPVLVSDIPEHIDLISNSHFLFSHGDVSSLQEKLLSLMQVDDAILLYEGKNNRALIEREFVWEKVMDKIVDVYTKPLTGEKIKSVLLESN